MSIIKNEIPILEYDTDDKAVIMPNHEDLEIELPERGVLAFLGKTVKDYAVSHSAIQVANFDSITKLFPLYVLKHKGYDVCLIQAPVGASAAVQILDWLNAYGTTKVISSGSCGVLEHMEENTFLVPYRALRDEGASYHYMEPSRFVDVDRRALKAIETALTDHGYRYQEVITWSTDGFYRETKDLVEYRKQDGCKVVEMECSALAACAKLRGSIWGEILFTGDTLADADNYDERSFGKDSMDKALELCLDAVIKL